MRMAKRSMLERFSRGSRLPWPKPTTMKTPRSADHRARRPARDLAGVPGVARQVGDPIFAFYPDGTYRYVNQAFASGVRLPARNDHRPADLGRLFAREADKRFAVVKIGARNAESKVFEVRVPRRTATATITTVKPIISSQREVVSVICISEDHQNARRWRNGWRAWRNSTR